MKYNSDSVRIEIAAPSDAAAILSVYRYYVEKTAVSFEYEVPSLEEFRKRIEKTLEKYPYLVAREGDKILGYAYTGPFKTRAAYDHAVEISIYVSPEAHGRGIGRALYEALGEICLKQHIFSLEACITYPSQDRPRGDEYLTLQSPLFHEHLGFRLVGRFDRCGYKFGRWYDMIWMEKHLGELPEKPDPIIPFPLLKQIL